MISTPPRTGMKRPSDAAADVLLAYLEGREVPRFIERH